MPIYSLVLTTPPTKPSLSRLAVEHAWSLIPEIQRRSQGWLAPGEAWQAEFATNEPQAVTMLRDDVKRALLGLTLDVNIVTGDAQSRRKKLLIADMDSTIIQQECIDEMAEVFGIKERIAAITERAMRGELDFEAALTHRLSLLAGISESDLERIFTERIKLMPGARTLTATMRANGAFTALVSGGFTFFTSRVAEAVLFNVNHANTLEIVDGRMTGNVVGPIIGREAKRETLERYRLEHNLVEAQTLAVGDGANDLAMIGAAGLGVAYRAKPIVAADADAQIEHGDLTSLLYLQGYRYDEFIE